MALYDTLFGMMDLQAAQLLVTPRDFRDETFKVGCLWVTALSMSQAAAHCRVHS